MLFRKNKKNNPASTARFEFYRHPCRNFDAVVFVHGFRGHFRNTWNLFPELLDGDPHLPSFDILLLGYPSGYRPGRPSIGRLGRDLMSDIRAHLADAKRVVFVCHSMGGVAVLSGVRDAMAGRQAQGDPVGRIDRFVLFGTPLKGTHIATFAKIFGFGIFYYTRLMNAQLRQLASGNFGHDFETDITNHIYRPDEDSKYDRRIPIHVCFGETDWVVNRREARSVILDPPSDSLEQGHFGIKNPPSREDKRYKALATKLQMTASAWFHDLAARAIHRDTPRGRRATHELWTRSEFAIDYRLRAMASGFDDLSDGERDRLREDLLIFAVEHAVADSTLSFRMALDAGAAALSFRLRGRR